MYAKVRFIQQNGLSKTYDYQIGDDLAKEVTPGDYVVIQSAKSDYSVGVLHQIVDKVDDPSIVTKAAVQKVNAQKCHEYTKGKINLGGY